jgi:hypothetical protein
VHCRPGHVTVNLLFSSRVSQQMKKSNIVRSRGAKKDPSKRADTQHFTEAFVFTANVDVPEPEAQLYQPVNLLDSCIVREELKRLPKEHTMTGNDFQSDAHVKTDFCVLGGGVFFYFFWVLGHCFFGIRYFQCSLFEFDDNQTTGMCFRYNHISLFIR